MRTGRLSKAGISLKFLIVGGGISGLGTAYALKKCGHDVLVVEKGAEKIKTYGGLQCPPNMTKVLYAWGLKPILDERAHKCSKFVFSNGNNGELVGSIVLDEEFLRTLMGDFLFIQHEDLREILFDLAVREGVEFRFNTSIVSANAAAESPSVALESGETLKADVIIGADGHDSVMRPIISDSDFEEGDDLTQGEDAVRNLVLTYVLQKELLDEDEQLKDMLSLQDWAIWMGDGYIMNANLLIGAKEMTVTLVHRYTRPRWPKDTEWTDKHDLDWYGLDFKNFEPRLQKLLKLARTVVAKIYVARPAPPEDLVSHQSKMVLVGSAAHPLMPGSNHGPALALEDAHTLGLLFSRIQSREQIPQLLTAYEEIRHPRTAWATEYDYKHLDGLKMPAGLLADQRDAILRQTMAYGDWDHMEEAMFKAVWGTELDLFYHNAEEKVDDWWSQWGSILRGSEREESEQQSTGGHRRGSVMVENMKVQTIEH